MNQHIQAEPLTILHVIHSLGHGGASRAATEFANISEKTGKIRNSFLLLDQIRNNHSNPAKNHNLFSTIELFTPETASECQNKRNQYDFILVHFWNYPEVYDFLATLNDTKNLVIWCHINGTFAPHILPNKLIQTAALTFTSSPLTVKLKDAELALKMYATISPTNFSDLHFNKPNQQEKFVIGYIGSIDFSKMHKNFFKLIEKIDIPDCSFLIAGSGRGLRTVKKELENSSLKNRITFLGQISDVSEFYKNISVLGHALSPTHMGTSECVVQEAMYCEIPPVILNPCAASHLVTHNHNGLLTNTDSEFISSIEFLYNNPEIRQELGKNAKKTALTLFCAEKNVAKMIRKISTITKKNTANVEPFNQQDKTPSKTLSMSDKLIYSYDVDGNCFIQSKTCSNLSQTIKADFEIYSRSNEFASSGGVYNYLLFDEMDPFLQLWSGLIMESESQLGMAYLQYDKASQHNSLRLRSRLYQHRVAKNLSNPSLEQKSWNLLKNISPDLTPAKIKKLNSQWNTWVKEMTA